MCTSVPEMDAIRRQCQKAHSILEQSLGKRAEASGSLGSIPRSQAHGNHAHAGRRRAICSGFIANGLEPLKRDADAEKVRTHRSEGIHGRCGACQWTGQEGVSQETTKKQEGGCLMEM